MEISRLFLKCYITILLAYCADTKTFSINEALANESLSISTKKSGASTQHIQQSHKTTTYKPQSIVKDKYKKLSAKQSFVDLLPAAASKQTDTTITQIKNIRPGRYHKAFEVNIPAKLKTLKTKRKSLHKLKNQSIKRAINENESKKHKHIPLLKGISMLFDNILNAEPNDVTSFRITKGKRYGHNEDDLNVEPSNIACKCSHVDNTNVPDEQPQQKTVTFSKNPATEISSDTKLETEITTETTNNITFSNISSVRQNSNIPSLLTRDPSRSWRDDNRFNKRGRTTFYSSPQRNFTGYNRNSQYNSRSKGLRTYAKDHEENTNSTTRDSPQRFRTTKEIRRVGTGVRYTKSGLTKNRENSSTENKNTAGKTGRDVEKSEIKNKIENGGNATEESTHISHATGGRLRGHLSKAQVDNYTESIQPIKANEKSYISVTEYSPCYQPVTEGNGSFTTKDQGISNTDATINKIIHYENNDNKEENVVMIIDGYSVARGKYGDNKIAEKAIHIAL